MTLTTIAERQKTTTRNKFIWHKIMRIFRHSYVVYACRSTTGMKQVPKERERKRGAGQEGVAKSNVNDASDAKLW